MKKLNTLILLLLVCSAVNAQKYFATTFDKLPQNYQLYPRNELNEAIIPISGKIEETGWDYFSVQLFRNKTQVGYQKAPITYANSVGKFSFSSIKIKAEKAEYDVKIFAVKGKDSLSITTRENIVAGDVYVISGQSNSTCFFNDTRTNEYCRTFGKTMGTSGISTGSPADTLWTLSNQDAFNQGVGTMGFEFQQTILNKYGIPTCLINGGFHNSSMSQHATRNANNPADLTTGYGRMLYRLQKAGVDKSVKAFIYRQGESEAYGEGTDWSGNFDIYYKNLKTDLPSIKQIYLFQIDVIGYTQLPQSPQIRDIQRREVDKYADIQVVASIGTAGFDGLHYTPEGYMQNAQEFSRLVGRDFYGSTDIDNIDAPNLRKAYFSKKDKTEITLVFQSSQDLSFTPQPRNLVMKNQFYLDGINGVVNTNSASGNKIVLSLNSASSASLISYLPPFILNSDPEYPYIGPYIVNKKGLRALTFHQVKIESYESNLPIPTITYSKIPQNLQLFPRNAKNEANVTIAGKVDSPDYTSLTLQVLRNNATVKYYKSNLTYVANSANFAFSHTIKAELANYHFKLYAIKGTDSVLVTSRENIVSGDVFVINGQSNAAAWNISTTFPNYDYRNEFCRTFGQAPTNNPYITNADTTWALSNASKPYVGVWGIELQKMLMEKYAIPTCFLNEAVGGSAITEHTNRDVTNPSNVSNIYGRLLYRAKKAGVLDNIKGFFYWQGEAEALDKPSVWKTEFEKLYNFWKTDYPAVGKFYIFQINIIGVPIIEAGELRDFQRQIKKNYVKTEVIATIGNSGYDGTHYSVEGYKKVASDVLRLVARDFYGSVDTVQIVSPNVQKIYYSTLAKDEITILFEDTQKMIWTADSTYKQDDGLLRKYFMKDYIYLNNTTDKVVSGRAENNKIVLKTTGFTSGQSLTYLPPYFPMNYPVDLRGIFGGPFLKNQRGMSAFSFYKQAISDPLSSPTLTAKIKTATSVELTWTEISTATSYVLEIKDLQADKYTVVKTLPKGTLTYLSDNLLGSTNYTFRIRAIALNVESEYSSVQIQTPKALDIPKVTGVSTYVDAIKVSWAAVPDAINYIVERKNNTTSAYEQLAKVAATVLEYQDKSLEANTLYTYRVKALGTFTESPFGEVQVKTLDFLQNSNIAVTVVYNNSLKIDWKSVPNATYYILERKVANLDFRNWGTFESAVLSFTDKDLVPNTVYTYRVKALSDKSESPFVTAENKTPALLATPEVTITVNSFDALKIAWKTIPNVTQYVLERRLNEADAFKELVKLDALQTEYSDTQLKEKTTYFYRIKALGDKTESEYVSVKATTATILKTEEEILEGITLFPNPSHTQVTIRFSEPKSGHISIVDLRGVEYFQEEIRKVNDLTIPLNRFPKGIYLVNFKTEERSVNKKIVVE
ncbi:putative secreted protein (Por secretion system target) [Arcicella aurantiaca]|uniref:Putative secreted protein (Por secretion system target) n=1 Tax=Arcicella aurantiaca TaxID=591202 RepID=A0A316DH62_9BACT|nr:sialate O-acetylesterase [Arcicella aurantiaca]PWK17006.1 putative secreted protein (Por secretion system target) [Arcicella aurantiaca]